MASLKSEHPGGNLSKTWLWHTGGTIWISAGVTDAQHHLPQVPPFSLLSSYSQQRHRTPWGAPLNGSQTQACVSALRSVGLPRANRLKLRVQLDAQSEPVNGSLPSSGPEETDLCAERVAEGAIKPHAYLPLWATPSSQGRGSHRHLTEGRPGTLEGLGQPTGQLALVTPRGRITRQEDHWSPCNYLPMFIQWFCLI